MKRRIALTAGAALVLTGCGATTIADVEPDTPRAEKDAVYATYLQDTYGEDYPAVYDNAGDLTQTVLRICSALDDGQSASTLDTALGLDRYDEEHQPVLLDSLYQGTRVYCPQHTNSVEWMNVGAQ